METDNPPELEKSLLMPPAQLYRLSGGLKLIVDTNGKSHLIGALPGREIHFEMGRRRPGDILLNYKNVRMLTRSKCVDNEELNDQISNHFLMRILSQDGRCLAYGQRFYWSGVSYVLNQKGLLAEEALVRRLTTQIYKCLRRFEKLHRSYSLLLSKYSDLKIEEDTFTSNKFTSNIGSEFGSFLDDLYATRDAINALAYKILFGIDSSFKTEKFKAKILGLKSSAFAQLANQSMFDENGDLLIARMSTYRSVALHSMGTTNPIIPDSITFKKENGLLGHIWRPVYPLYDDMGKLKEIERATTIGFSFERTQDELLRFAGLPNHTDAMEFGFDCFARLLNMSRLLADELGLESRHVTLTDDDIVNVQMGSS